MGECHPRCHIGPLDFFILILDSLNLLLAVSSPLSPSSPPENIWLLLKWLPLGHPALETRLGASKMITVVAMLCFFTFLLLPEVWEWTSHSSALASVTRSAAQPCPLVTSHALFVILLVYGDGTKG